MLPVYLKHFYKDEALFSETKVVTSVYSQTFEGNLDNLFNKLKDRFNNALIDEKDGIRFDWPDSSWIHIRPSNTEPILRIIGEARTQKDIDALFAETKLTLEAK